MPLAVIKHFRGTLIAHIVQGYRAEDVGVTAAYDMQAGDVDDFLRLVCEEDVDLILRQRQWWPSSEKDGTLKFASALCPIFGWLGAK